MGIWEQDSSGYSFSGDGTTIWGDPFADIMDAAVGDIRDAFTEHIGRPPTVGEIKSGLFFALSFLNDAGEDAFATEENSNKAWELRDRNEDASTHPDIARLQPGWEETTKETYS